MRMWHKDLIQVLPRQQLIAQWRECCLIAKNIAETGKPNHLLVNKVMNYTSIDFWKYCLLVMQEMHRRGYKMASDSIRWLEIHINMCTFDSMNRYEVFRWELSKNESINTDALYPEWHNKKYLIQCFFNLQEKYDCGGITDEEWTKIYNLFLVKKNEGRATGNEVI